MLRHADFCCGSGGFTLALKGRVETVFANDFIKSSQVIFETNFNTPFVLSDIHLLKVQDIPEFDILTAGFPCQPFSIAGNKEGFSDDRSQVFWKLIEIIQYHKPRYFILENVKNLLSHDNKRTFQVIQDAIEKAGYKYKYSVLNTKKIVELPQNRERVYIVGFLEENDWCRFKFPKELAVNSSTISDVLEPNVDDKYYYTDKLKIWPVIKDNITEENCVYQYRRYYVRRTGNIAPTLTANMGTGGHNVPLIKDSRGIRKITPRECFRLQGFPECYKLVGTDSQLYSLAGNAISVPVVQRIVESLL